MGKQVKKRCKPYTPKPINLQGYVNIVRTIDIFLESDNEEKTQNAEMACDRMYQYFDGFLTQIKNGDGTLEHKAPMLLLSQMLNFYLGSKEFFYSYESTYIEDLDYPKEVLRGFNTRFEYFWDRTYLEEKIYFEPERFEYEAFKGALNLLSGGMFYLTDKDYKFIYDFSVREVREKGFFIKKEEKENGHVI